MSPETSSAGRTRTPAPDPNLRCAARRCRPNRDNAALPSDAAPDPDFGGPGGMAIWQSTRFLAFACAYAHRGEPASPQPCRTAESPLARTSARLGGFGLRARFAMGAERRCRTRALSRVRWDFAPPCARASALRERQNPVGGAREMKCAEGRSPEGRLPKATAKPPARARVRETPPRSAP